MGTLSPDELDGAAMHPTWMALDPVRGQQDNLTRFIHEELPRGTRYDIAGMNTVIRLCKEFNEIWPHRVPTRWELVLANRAGHLDQTIKEINAAFARGE